MGFRSEWQRPGLGGRPLLFEQIQDPTRVSRPEGRAWSQKRPLPIAVSQGCYGRLIVCSSSTNLSEIATGEQIRTGLSPGLLRWSVGCRGVLESRLEQSALPRVTDFRDMTVIGTMLNTP